MMCLFQRNGVLIEKEQILSEARARCQAALEETVNIRQHAEGYVLKDRKKEREKVRTKQRKERKKGREQLVKYR